MEKFLNSFGTDLEISDLQTIVSLETALSDTNRNFYYIPGDKKPSNNRAKDDDILATSTFFVDIDIKENLKEDQGEEDQTEEALLEYGNFIKDFCDSSETFKNWKYIVFSGNGIQVHFIGEKVKTVNKKNQWKFGVKYFLDLWDKEALIFFGINSFRSDKACCNLARLRRLPNTYNQKNGRKAKILHEKDSNFPIEDILPRGEEFYKIIIEREREAAKQEKQQLRRSLNFNEHNIFERINNIPVELIVSEILPQAVFDGKKNWRFAGQSNLCGFYKTPGNRVANGGSHYFLPYSKYGGESYSYSVFDLVHTLILNQTTYDTENIKKTLYFFKENYGQ